jgi:hypothetical protein
LNGRGETIKFNVDKTQKPFIESVISIGIVDTDLDGAFGPSGAATVSLILYCFESRIKLTCDRFRRPKRTTSQNHESHAWQTGSEGTRCLQRLSQIFLALDEELVIGKNKKDD